MMKTSAKFFSSLITLIKKTNELDTAEFARASSYEKKKSNKKKKYL